MTVLNILNCLVDFRLDFVRLLVLTFALEGGVLVGKVLKRSQGLLRHCSRCGKFSDVLSWRVGWHTHPARGSIFGLSVRYASNVLEVENLIFCVAVMCIEMIDTTS